MFQAIKTPIRAFSTSSIMKFNKVILAGRIVSDPNFVPIQPNKSSNRDGTDSSVRTFIGYWKFTLATKRVNRWQDKTDFHSIAMYIFTAQNWNPKWVKGALIGVDGYLRYNKTTPGDSSIPVAASPSAEVVATKLHWLEGPSSTSRAQDKVKYSLNHSQFERNPPGDGFEQESSRNTSTTEGPDLDFERNESPKNTSEQESSRNTSTTEGPDLDFERNESPKNTSEPKDQHNN